MFFHVYQKQVNTTNKTTNITVNLDILNRSIRIQHQEKQITNHTTSIGKDNNDRNTGNCFQHDRNAGNVPQLKRWIRDRS